MLRFQSLKCEGGYISVLRILMLSFLNVCSYTYIDHVEGRYVLFYAMIDGDFLSDHCSRFRCPLDKGVPNMTHVNIN